MESSDPWLDAAVRRFVQTKAMTERAIAQLSDEEFTRRPSPGFNSVAIIIRHLAGNMISRFTDFLTTDGDKPDRDRDGEFQDWPGTRGELMKRWEKGWSLLFDTLETLTSEDLAKTVYIRTKPHTVPEAIIRSLDHTGYHLGQILYLSRLLCSKEWKYLTVAPGKSAEFNAAMGAMPARDRKKQ